VEFQIQGAFVLTPPCTRKVRPIWVGSEAVGARHGAT
jgi:hypothetical protein